jgi:hypothetical protein
LTAPPSTLVSTAKASEQAAIYPPTLAMALLAFHRNVGPIRKESQAKYGAFADLRTVLETITPPLLDEGLVLTQCMDAAADDGRGAGASLLRTELTHAPTGEQIRSTCLIPSLQSLLDRVHQLRGEVLQRYPLDLQLAAIGALPPVLPPRNVAPQGAPSGETLASELPPPAPRQPGLRIEDQLKGLHTLLGQLGTTVNPLHTLGGTITYLRRYQILGLLCLAPADDDGAFDRYGPASALQSAPHGATLQSAPHGATLQSAPGGATSAAQQAPPPAASRSPRAPRSSRSKQETPRAHPTPPPSAPGAADQPSAPGGADAPSAPSGADLPSAPSGADLSGAPSGATPQAAQPPAQPSPPPDAAQQELTPAEVQQLIGLIRTLPTDRVAALAQSFRDQYGLQPSQLVSDYIKTATHAAFIRQQVNQLLPLEANTRG